MCLLTFSTSYAAMTALKLNNTQKLAWLSHIIQPYLQHDPSSPVLVLPFSPILLNLSDEGTMAV